MGMVCKAMFRGLSAIRSHSLVLRPVLAAVSLSSALLPPFASCCRRTDLPLFTLRSSDTEVLTCGCTLRAGSIQYAESMVRSSAGPRATCEYDGLALAVAGRCACMLAGPSVAREYVSKYNYARAQTFASNDHARTRALLAVLLAVYSQTHLTCKELGQCSKLRIRCPFWDPRDFSPQYLPFLVTSF